MQVVQERQRGLSSAISYQLRIDSDGTELRSLGSKRRIQATFGDGEAVIIVESDADPHIDFRKPCGAFHRKFVRWIFKEIWRRFQRREPAIYRIVT